MNYYIILLNSITYPRAKRSIRANEIGRCGIIMEANGGMHKTQKQSTILIIFACGNGDITSAQSICLTKR